MALADTLAGVADAVRSISGTDGGLALADMPDLILGMDREVDELAASIIDRSITAYENAQLTRLADYAFSYCSELASLSMPALVEAGEMVFSYCSSLASVDLPCATEFGLNAFAKCTALTEVSLPVLVETPDNLFSQCTALVYADLPVATTLGRYCFSYCSSLTSFNLPVATSLGAYSFQYCTSLATADFEAAESFSGYTFRGCTALTALVLRASTVCTSSSTTGLTGTPIADGTGYAYVPSALLEEYQADGFWSTYADQLRAIEDYPDVCGES